MQTNKFKVLVHTVQMRSGELLNENVLSRDCKYLSKNLDRYTKRGLLYKINPNEYMGPLYKYSDFKLIMEAIQEELEISEWEYDRIDVAVDSTSSYEDLFKINKYLISLLDLCMGSDSFTDTRGGMKLEKRSLKTWKRKLDIEVYDKNLESEGKHPYTRCEFRFKLLNKEREQRIFDDIYAMLDGCKIHIDDLNKTKTKCLYKIWCKEKKEGTVLSINEFYRKYADEIYTVEISKELFRKITKNESRYKDWIGNFRRKLDIKFVSRRSLDQYISNIKDAIESYRTS